MENLNVQFNTYLPIVPHFPHTTHLKKVIRINHIKECKNLDQCVSKLPIFPKGIFLEKLTNITFAYLLSPFILQHLKQILRADPYIFGCIRLGLIFGCIRFGCIRFLLKFQLTDINFVYLMYPIIILQ